MLVNALVFKRKGLIRLSSYRQAVDSFEHRPTQRAPDPWANARTVVVGVGAFSPVPAARCRQAAYVAWSWFRQLASSRPAHQWVTRATGLLYGRTERTIL
jgi:hypothetical protein